MDVYAVSAQAFTSSTALEIWRAPHHLPYFGTVGSAHLGSKLVASDNFSILNSQTPIGDVQYMKAMIPHHSSAILTSERADIKDPEVKKLTEDIVKAQRKEIAEMEALLIKLNK